jgi:Straboviridae DNA polymerase processivity component
MRISPETQQILKNFASINTGIIFIPGQKIRTRTDSVFAEATVQEDFPLEKSITDLGNLLSVLGLFTDPVLSFEDNLLRIAESNGSAETLYAYSKGVQVVLPFPKKMMPIPDKVVEFVLTEEQLTKLQKATSIFQKPEYKITSDGKTLRMGTANHKADGGDSFSVVLDAKPNGIKCNMVYQKDHLTLMKGSYNGIVTPTYTLLKHTVLSLSYYIGVEPTTSRFGG